MKLLSAEYIQSKRQSHKHCILVEGRTEEKFWNLFKAHLIKNSQKLAIPEDKLEIVKNLLIDTPAQFTISGISGNSNLVKKMGELAWADSNPPKLVVLSDREFERFRGHSSGILDRIRAQSVRDNIILTRGHSLENYFFEISCLREKLSELAAKCDADASKVVPHFLGSLPEVVATAAGLSHFGRKKGCIRQISACLKPVDFSWTTDYTLKTGRLEQELGNQRNFSATQLHLDLMQSIDLAKRSDAEVLRWYSHGHLTEKLLVASFYKLCKPNARDLAKSFSIDDLKLGYITAWLSGRKDAPSLAETPYVCIDLLKRLFP